MTTLVKRYSSFLLVLVLLGILSLFNQELGTGVFNITVMQLKEMLLVIPPIFVLLGLLDVWVPKQTMVKFMGKGSGLKGILLSLFIGSAAAGPLYGAFPVAAVFMKKGVTFSNVLIFIGAWSTTKIPMILFEFSALGAPFALTRLLIDIPGIIIISFLLTRMIGKEEIEAIHERASKQ
ncbi:MAG: permease [Sphaerochaeta sp.]|uniref:permease n=1 Tax=Sphaerochaeta sp. S2 TaxID=2798868 RepID=UPI0018E949AC|nr:permease [Sphaerochaeta sp. S2]MCK9347936.1 permease [Sphaerochaeta sp.]MBJ2355171.1 permease [Sphaerochaeta sp. S2]MDD4301537.1 permease [Sphaerochaeta sp.]MDD4647067.1 permease [Sphaerochaeta sp.]MDY0243637.1 permease [Sphaerochaeta sp.]